MRRQPNQQDMEAALKWWRSVPNGKKRYLKEHGKLNDAILITRYWIANIKDYSK